MAEPDDVLESRLRAGDVDALASYVGRKRTALLAFVERRLGADLRRRVDPDDVCQETVVASLQALARGDALPDALFAWLCALADQRIADVARRHHAEKRDVRREVSAHTPISGPNETSAELIALLSASLTSASLRAVRSERQARLEACLAELPEPTREALRLRYGEGLPTRDVAERLGKTDVAVRVLLSRTLQELQKRLLAAED